MEALISIAAMADGRKIVLEDDADIVLSLISNGEVKDTFPFPELSGNYGGGSLFLSPSEKYVVFSYFSGENEEGFALLQIESCQLKLLYDSKYLYGEDAHYSFTNNEHILVQTFRTGAYYKDEAETDENGDLYYAFGEINLLSIGTYNLDRHTVLVYPPDDWEEGKTDAGAFLFSNIADGKLLNAEMPWGSETFPYPLQGTLVIRFNQ